MALQDAIKGKDMKSNEQRNELAELVEKLRAEKKVVPTADEIQAENNRAHAEAELMDKAMRMFNGQKALAAMRKLHADAPGEFQRRYENGEIRIAVDMKEVESFQPMCECGLPIDMSSYHQHVGADFIEGKIKNKMSQAHNGDFCAGRKMMQTRTCACGKGHIIVVVIGVAEYE